MKSSRLQPQRHILIVYYNVQYPCRSAVLDHLYSFGRYAEARCYYLNAAVGGVPGYLRYVRFDLVVFHTSFLSIRWHRSTFEKAVEKIRALNEIGGVKIALPQDEFIHMDLVCDFINAFNIRHVFSVAMPSEWKKIYHTVDTTRVTFHQVLTGYLEQSAVNRIGGLTEEVPTRTIDIGYRAWKSEPWLGRHGVLKTRIAELFQTMAPPRGLAVDISTRHEDTLYGDDWYRFLLRSRYTIGVEGGASLLDWEGSIRERTLAYLREHPDAAFADVEAACFPRLDGQLNLRAISPRQFEACATKTCQVLVEGEYNGILKPGIHYIALQRDFSNLEDVLTRIKADTERNRIVETAYRDIVVLGEYGYNRFVQHVVETSIPGDTPLPHVPVSLNRTSGFIWRWMRCRDRFSWFVVRVAGWAAPVRQGFASLLLRTAVGQRLRKRRQSRPSRS